MGATCQVFRSVDDAALRQGAWRVYLDAFADASMMCIQQQICYSEADFNQALLDADYMKFMLLGDGGDVLGFVLATDNLDKARVAYVNPTRLEAANPAYQGNILYFTAIAIRPDIQGQRLTEPLFDAITLHVDKHGCLVAFDFSVEKTSALPMMLIRAAKRAQRKFGLKTTTAEYTALGGQEYGVLKLL